MDERVNEILERLPSKSPRSRLDEHAALIEELRRRGRTYVEISQLLAAECQVQTSPSNIFYFVKARGRKAKQSRAPLAKPPKPSGAVAAKPSIIQPSNLTTDVAQRISALKQRKPQPPTPDFGFSFDPDEPLGLINHEDPSTYGKSKKKRC